MNYHVNFSIVVFCCFCKVVSLVSFCFHSQFSSSLSCLSLVQYNLFIATSTATLIGYANKILLFCMITVTVLRLTERESIMPLNGQAKHYIILALASFALSLSVPCKCCFMSYEILFPVHTVLYNVNIVRNISEMSTTMHSAKVSSDHTLLTLFFCIISS